MIICANTEFIDQSDSFRHQHGFIFQISRMLLSIKFCAQCYETFEVADCSAGLNAPERRHLLEWRYLKLYAGRGICSWINNGMLANYVKGCISTKHVVDTRPIMFKNLQEYFRGVKNYAKDNCLSHNPHLKWKLLS